MGRNFTSETAKIAAKRRAAVWNANKQAACIVANENGEGELFRIRRLARVRVQLERLDKQLADETDPARLDRLCAALNRLQDAEGWLANRAKPGNLKPVAERKPRAGSFAPPPPPDDDDGAPS